MTVYKIAKSFCFDASHMLDNHGGKCRNLHGHTYRLVVEIEGPLINHGPNNGMVADFSQLKMLVNTHLLEQLDHAFLYNENNENETKIAKLLINMDRKVFAFPSCTTAELMSSYIYHHLSAYLPISMIKLWETPTSYCEYRKPSP